ncbi:MAG TPA: ribosome biogenesis GTPase Der [Chloroflexota bacterium]|nr:ribosome biogenesis GTPase Der [Chloroflexota bacterium]
MKPLVAIVGRPNVGKSTLFNRLVGGRRAIVEDVPGTTRDRLYGDVEWAGRTFTLIDTGGLEVSPGSDMLARVAAQVRVAVEEADLILLAVDSVDGLTAADEEIARLLRQGNLTGQAAQAGQSGPGAPRGGTLKPVIVVAGKADNEQRREAANDFYRLGFDTVIPVSAYHGSNSGDLLDAVVERLGAPAVEDEAEDDRLKVAIVGRPNVGKSQLLNTLLGEERVVVSEVPGTTRDAIDTELEYAGRRFLLIDTAGIRRRGKIEPGIEKYSVLRSVRAVGRADVALLVVDATELLAAQDLHIAGEIEEEGKGVVLVVNKWDLVEKDTHTVQRYQEQIARELNFMPWVPTVYISALTGQRVRRVLDEALAVDAERHKRVSTGELNELISHAVGTHPPASHKGRQLKVLYATQVDVAPPTFVFFVNDPSLVHFAYERFLENTLRRAYGFRGTAIRLRFRSRQANENGRRRRS